MSPETGSSHTLVLDTKSSEAVYTVVSFVEMATSLAHEVIARYETDHDAVVQIHEAGERGTTYSIYRLNSVREQQIPNYLTFSAEGFLIQAIF